MPDLSKIWALYIIIVSGFLLYINTLALNFSLYPKDTFLVYSEEVKYSESHKIEPERSEITSCYSSVNAKFPFEFLP